MMRSTIIEHCGDCQHDKRGGSICEKCVKGTVDKLYLSQKEIQCPIGFERRKDGKSNKCEKEK